MSRSIHSTSATGPPARSDQRRAEAEELLLHEIKGAHAVLGASEDECTFGHAHTNEELVAAARAEIAKLQGLRQPTGDAIDEHRSAVD